jgi:hypothetical protein
VGCSSVAPVSFRCGGDGRGIFPMAIYEKSRVGERIVFPHKYICHTQVRNTG